MKLQTILNRLQKLHPKEIDLSLDRVKNLCKKLGDPQKKLKYISVVGTNGKYSTIQAVRSILKTANINCNIYTSPHIQKINERFIFNDIEISDDNLSDLLRTRIIGRSLLSHQSINFESSSLNGCLMSIIMQIAIRLFLVIR